jgi:hypothetical protein
MSYTYTQLSLADTELDPIRSALYEPSGPGYFIFKSFISPAQTDAMVRFWSAATQSGFAPFVSKFGIFDGCPNYRLDRGNGQLSYFNFFWNKPADELTYSIALSMQMLRNRIEGKPLFREIYPLQQRSASFRIVISARGRNIVSPHRDWLGNNFDPLRTQMTLFLTEKGVDYDGNAFLFETNQGQKISFGTDVKVQPGDLIVWRYNNEHSIDVVESSPDQHGFMRMIFPPEYVYRRLPLARLWLSAAYRMRSVGALASWINERLDRSKNPSEKHAD